MADPSLIDKQIKTSYWKGLTNLLISAILCALVAVKSNLAQKLPTSVVIGPGDVFRVSKHMFCDASAVSFEASLSDFKSAVQLSPAMPMNVWPASKQVQLKTNVGNCSLVSVLPPAEEFNFAQRIVVLCENKDLYLMELQEDIGQTTVKQGPLFVTKSLETKHVCIGMSFT